MLAVMVYGAYSFAGQVVVLVALAVAATGAGIGALVARRRPWPAVWLAGVVGAIVGFAAGTAAVLGLLAVVFAGWPS
jgi:hypothetical protein